MAIDLKRFDRYLGDGVYASFDGYHVWLAVNHHQNKVVALEPRVMSALFEHAGFIHDEIKTEVRKEGEPENES